MRHVPIPLYVVVPANSALNVCSASLAGALQIDSIEMTWPTGTYLNLTYQFFLLGAILQNNTLKPGGGELTLPYISPGYFAGDGISKEYVFQVPVTAERAYLAMYVTNNTPNNWSASAVATISVEP